MILLQIDVEMRNDMVNSNRLTAYMALFGDTQYSLAEKLGICRSFLSKKIRNIDEFKLSEVHKIINLYNLNPQDVMYIFFDDDDKQ